MALVVQECGGLGIAEAAHRNPKAAPLGLHDKLLNGVKEGSNAETYPLNQLVFSCLPGCQVRTRCTMTACCGCAPSKVVCPSPAGLLVLAC
jgi:hypothetical protein